MKIAKKRRRKSLKKSSPRLTLTLTAETYGKINQLQDEEPRSSLIERMVEQEKRRYERKRLAERLSKEYTAAVMRETLALNQEFPVHKN